MAGPDASRSINIAFTGTTDDVAKATRRVQATVQRAVKGIDGLTGTINIDADGKKAQAKVERLEKQIEKLKAEVKVTADTKRAQVAINRFKRRNDGRLIRLDVGVGSNQFGNLRNQISSIRDALRRAIPTNIITFLPLAGALVTALAGLAGAIIGLISSLGLASAAFVAVLPAALALGAAFGAIALAADAIKESEGWARLKRNIDQLKRTAANELVPAFNDFARTIQAVFPLVNRHIRQVSRGLGESLREIGAYLAMARSLEQLDNVFRSNERSLISLGGAARSLVGIILTLSEATGPLFERFSEALGSMLSRFNTFLGFQRETGELADFFNRAGDEAALWGRIFRNVFTGLGGVFQAALGPGQGLALALERMTASFRTWANSASGQESVRSVLQFLADLDYVRIFQVAAAISAIGIAIKTLIGGANILQGLVGILSLGPVGIAIGLIVVALGLLAGAFVLAYTSSAPFRDAINGIISRLREDFLPIVERVADRVSEFWDRISGGTSEDGFQKLLESVQGFWDIVQRVYRAVVGYVEDMVARFEASDLEGFFNSVSHSAGLVVDAIKFLVSQFAELFDSMMPAREEGDNLNFILSAMALALKIVAGLLTGFIYLWGSVIRVIAEVVSAIRGFVGWFGSSWSHIWDEAGNDVSTAGSWIADLFTTKIPGWIDAFGKWFHDGWEQMWIGAAEDLSRFWEWLKGVWNTLTAYIGQRWETTKNQVRLLALYITFRFNEIRNTIRAAIQAAVLFVLDKLREMQNGVTAFRDRAVAAFTNLRDRAIGIVRDMIQTIKNMFSSLRISIPTPNFLGGLSGALSGFLGRALGGPVNAGQPYWVNEAGAGKELFIPDQDGRIVNKSQAAGMGGGTTQVEVILTGLPEAFRDTVKVEVREINSAARRRAAKAVG